MDRRQTLLSGLLASITPLLLFSVVLPASFLKSEIRIPVWVENSTSEGRPPAVDLGPGAFRVILDGKEASVRAVIPPEGNLVLLLVMDVVEELSRVVTAREALIEAVNALGPREYVGLLRAQNGMEVMLDPTPDRRKLGEAIAGVELSAAAGLLDSLEPVAGIANRILRESEVRVAVVYITDASIYDYRGDYTSPVINPSDRSDLSRRFRDSLIQEEISRNLALLRRFRVPMFFLHLDRNRNSLDQVYQNGLNQFAEATSGEVLFCNSAAEVRTSVHRVIERATNFYTVTVDVPADVSGRIDVEVATSAGLDLTYPQTVEIAEPENRVEDAGTH